MNKKKMLLRSIAILLTFMLLVAAPSCARPTRYKNVFEQWAHSIESRLGGVVITRFAILAILHIMCDSKWKT